MSDKELINNCISTYYEGCLESDPNKIKEAFDENAMISGYLPDGLHEMNLDEFAGFVDAQKPSPKEKGDEEFIEVISCEVVGDTAIVQIREAYLGMIFVDSFSFLKKKVFKVKCSLFPPTITPKHFQHDLRISPHIISNTPDMATESCLYASLNRLRLSCLIRNFIENRL